MVTGCRITIGDAQATLREEHDISVPIWKLRRVVDKLEHDEQLSVQRAGMSRMIDVDDVQVIADELRRIRWSGCEDE